MRNKDVPLLLRRSGGVPSVLPEAKPCCRANSFRPSRFHPLWGPHGAGPVGNAGHHSGRLPDQRLRTIRMSRSSSAAPAAFQAFCRRQNLAAGRIHFARAASIRSGVPAGLAPVGNAGHYPSGLLPDQLLRAIRFPKADGSGTQPRPAPSVLIPDPECSSSPSAFSCGTAPGRPHRSPAE